MKLAQGTQLNSVVSNAAAPLPLYAVDTLFANVIRAVLAIAAIVLFFMLIRGALSLISAAGSPDKAAAARNTITYAILGLVFLSMSYLILLFLASFTGIDALRSFRIYLPR